MIVVMRRKHHIDGLKSLIQDVPGGEMAEIGCYAGESTELFEQSGKFTKIYAIDPWVEGYDDSRAANSDMGMAERLFDRRTGDLVEKMKMTSEEASKEIKYVDFLYIDGSHKYEDVKQDILLWAGKCKFLGLHDYGTKRNPGVTKAIHELLGKPTKTYKDTSCLFEL